MRVWDHLKGLYADPLIKVPWHVHESGRRREIIEEDHLRATYCRARDRRGPPCESRVRVSDGGTRRRVGQDDLIDEPLD